MKEKRNCSVKVMLCYVMQKLTFQSLEGRDEEKEEDISSNLDKANKGEC